MPRTRFHFRARILTALLLTVGMASPAWAVMTIPEALGTGSQLGANGEAAVGGSLGTSQNSVQTTTGQVGPGTTGTTGIGNVNATGSPANGVGSLAGATATGTYPVTLNCKTRNPIFPGGYGLDAYNCLYQGPAATAQVSSLTLQYCLASINGGDCNPGSPNWQSTGIAPGQSVQLSSSISLALNSCPADASGTCTGTLTVNNSTIKPTSGSALTNEATNEVTAGTNGYQNSLEATFNSGAYQASIQTGNQTFQLNSCTQQIKGGLNGNGIVYTCNGQQSADFGGSCTTTSQCVRWATQSNNYTETCNQDLPLTMNTCTTVTPTQNCTITSSQAPYQCSDTYNATVAWTTRQVASCSPGQQVASCPLQFYGPYLMPNGAGGGTLTVTCTPGTSAINVSLYEPYGTLLLAGAVPVNGSLSATDGSDTDVPMGVNGSVSATLTGGTLTITGSESSYDQFNSPLSYQSTCSVTIGWPEVKTINVPYISSQGWTNGCAIYQSAG
ncbi:hypothetical protein [Thiomonas sp.]